MRCKLSYQDLKREYEALLNGTKPIMKKLYDLNRTKDKFKNENKELKDMLKKKDKEIIELSYLITELLRQR